MREENLKELTRDPAKIFVLAKDLREEEEQAL